MELIYKNKKSIEEIENIIDIKLNNICQLPIDISNLGVYIFGDNFDGMVQLLNKFENSIDLVYIDPPFNTKGSFYYDKDITSTISTSKNNLVAYHDDMDIEEYLEFIRERLVLIRRLLSPCGTLYFHIDYKVGHYIKLILDEVFGSENFVSDIARVKSNPKNFSRRAYGNEKDLILVYSKQKNKNIFNDIRIKLEASELDKLYKKVDSVGRKYTTVPCHAPGETTKGVTGSYWKGMLPPKGRHWRYSPDKLTELDEAGRIEWSKNQVPRVIKYASEHKGKKIQDVWKNYKDPQRPTYPTEKNMEMLEMIVQQSSNENSIIMDCFCGSGSFLEAGKKYNRYVIGIDKSIISKQVVENRPSLEGIEVFLLGAGR